MPFYSLARRSNGVPLGYHAASDVGLSIDGLNAAWLMDETSGSVVNDTSGANLNNGSPWSTTSITGATIVAGKHNNARSFSPTQYLTFPNTSGLIGNGAAPFTISFWLKIAANPSSGNAFLITRFHQDTEFFTTYYNNSGTIETYGTFRGQTQWGAPVSNSAGQIGNWAHYCYTYNGGGKSTQGSFAIYQNGVALTNNVNLGTAGNAVNETVIGTDNNGSSLINSLNGVLDSVLVFNRVLTSAEITALANANSVITKGDRKVYLF